MKKVRIGITVFKCCIWFGKDPTRKEGFLHERIWIGVFGNSSG
jgi:hypothetical protein